MTKNSLLYFFITLLIVGCNSKEIDIRGVWIPEKGYNPTLIISDKSIIISHDYNIEEYSYILKNNKLIPSDSPGKWLHEGKNINTDTFEIKKASNDTLILFYNNYKCNVLFKHLNLNPTKISKIRLFNTNGWNQGFMIDVDRSGLIKIWKEDAWTKTQYFGTSQLDSISLENTLLFSNYLYSNNDIKINVGSSCSDCKSYGLSIHKEDSIKSYYFDEYSKHSMISMIIEPIMDFARKANLKQTDTIAKLPFPKHFGERTTIFEKIKQ